MIPLAQLELAAQAITQTPTTIVCQSPWPYPRDAAYTIQRPDGSYAAVIYLPRATCARLEHDDTSASIATGDILAVTHEAEHIHLQSPDECLVEAAAVANVWPVLHALGLSAWRDTAILAAIPIDDAELPAAYHPENGSC